MSRVQSDFLYGPKVSKSLNWCKVYQYIDNYIYNAICALCIYYIESVKLHLHMRIAEPALEWRLLHGINKLHKPFDWVGGG